jgi:2-oxoglutarate dehydrogenase E2 component (dihydrolipoamide succinyltransferase)
MGERVEIRAPADQGEGARLQILRWLKHSGERVALNEPLLEIETDKVTVEVPSPGEGVLGQVLRQEQEEVAPGELLGHIEAGLQEPSAPRAAAAAAPERAREPAAAPAGAREALRGAPAAAALSPAVRRLLAERGLEAAALSGSGPGGRIMVEDVLRAETGVSAPAAAQPAAVPAAAAGVRRVPHTAVRRRIAEHMVQSLLHAAPHVTSVFEADLSAVLRDRAARRGEFAQRGAPLTLSAYFVQATVAAIRAVPEANSRWSEDAIEIYEAMHIGIGTAVEDVGLVVPVLRDAQSLDLFATARGLDDLVSRARDNKLTPADVRGGTFTISNHGVSGSLLAAPIIINQPQAAILGIGKLEKRAVVQEQGDEQKIVVRPRCYVTLTLDHRVMDGHQANRFLQSFVDTLNHWPA